MARSRALVAALAVLAAGTAAAQVEPEPPPRAWMRFDLAYGLAPGGTGGGGPRLLLLPLEHFGLRAAVSSWHPSVDVTSTAPPSTVVGPDDSTVQAYQLELVFVAPFPRYELWLAAGAGRIEANAGVEVAQQDWLVIPGAKAVVDEGGDARSYTLAAGARWDLRRKGSWLLGIGVEAQLFLSEELHFGSLGGWSPPTSGLLVAFTGSVGLAPRAGGAPADVARGPSHPRFGRAELFAGLAPGGDLGTGARVVLQPLPWLGVRGSALSWNPPVEVAAPGTTQTVVGNTDAACTGVFVDAIGAVHRGPLELYTAAGLGTIHSESHADVMVPPSTEVFRDNASSDDRAVDVAVGAQYHAPLRRFGVLSLGVEAQWIFADRPTFEELGGLSPQNDGLAFWAGASFGF